jgi:hypothetical protein
MRNYPLHLCQPDNTKSCGACCGLYNVEDHSRETLISLLEKRTELFFSSGEKPDVDRYGREIKAFPPLPKLSETIYNCEFLGFVDRDYRRVGCLLHPVFNHGVDLRTCSFYGAILCRDHFCISFTCLSPVEQRAVISSLDDWYLYGLVITDVDFVKAFFAHVQNRLGDSLRDDRLDTLPVQTALRDFFELKVSWKFLSRIKRLGTYYLSQAEYHIARPDYKKTWGMEPSRFDTIFKSLASVFKSEDDVREAEAIIEEKIRRFIEEYH